MTSENVREAEFNRLVAKAEDLDERIAADKCIRPTPPGAEPCFQGYDHTGHCDWFAAAYTQVMATINAKATS